MDSVCAMFMASYNCSFGSFQCEVMRCTGLQAGASQRRRIGLKNSLNMSGEGRGTRAFYQRGGKVLKSDTRHRIGPVISPGSAPDFRSPTVSNG
jgi:hypothetical protein